MLWGHALDQVAGDLPAGELVPVVTQWVRAAVVT